KLLAVWKHDGEGRTRAILGLLEREEAAGDVGGGPGFLVGGLAQFDLCACAGDGGEELAVPVNDLGDDVVFFPEVFAEELFDVRFLKGFDLGGFGGQLDGLASLGQLQACGFASRILLEGDRDLVGEGEREAALLLERLQLEDELIGDVESEAAVLVEDSERRV